MPSPLHSVIPNSRTSPWASSEVSFLRAFYLMVFVDAALTTFIKFDHFLMHSKIIIDYPYTLAFLKPFPRAWLAVSMIALTVISLLVTLHDPRIRWGRILTAIAFVLSKGLIFSYSGFAHQAWPMLWALVFLALCPNLTDDHGKSEFRTTIRQIQVVLCLFYAFPGLWKFSTAITNGYLFDPLTGPNVLAFYFILWNKTAMLGDAFLQTGVVGTILFWCMASLQAATGVVWRFKRLHRPWALGVLTFHFITVLLFTVNYFIAGLVFFLFFYLDPTRENPEESVPQNG